MHIPAVAVATVIRHMLLIYPLGMQQQRSQRCIVSPQLYRPTSNRHIAGNLMRCYTTPNTVCQAQTYNNRHLVGNLSVRSAETLTSHVKSAYRLQLPLPFPEYCVRERNRKNRMNRMQQPPELPPCPGLLWT
jgi:hypothetical protein